MTTDLRNQIASLSAAEKAELLDTVWASLEADSLSLIAEQRAELDARIARHEQNPAAVVPWEQVRANLFKNMPQIHLSPQQALSWRAAYPVIGLTLPGQTRYTSMVCLYYHVPSGAPR